MDLPSESEKLDSIPLEKFIKIWCNIIKRSDRMGSFSLHVDSPPEICFQIVLETLRNSELRMKRTIPKKSLLLQEGKDFSILLLLMLIPLFWPLAFVCYIVSDSNSLSVSFEKNHSGCFISAVSSGKKADWQLARIHAAVASIPREEIPFF
jgi:hypothetical protein